MTELSLNVMPRLRVSHLLPGEIFVNSIHMAKSVHAVVTIVGVMRFHFSSMNAQGLLNLAHRITEIANRKAVADQSSMIISNEEVAVIDEIFVDRSALVDSQRSLAFEISRKVVNQPKRNHYFSEATTFTENVDSHFAERVIAHYPLQ